MSGPSKNVDLTVRIRCFLCDALRHPWSVLKECNEWVCRQCINYEGNHRLPYTINNVKLMKANVREHLGLRLSNKNNFGNPLANPNLVTLPNNASAVNYPNVWSNMTNAPINLTSEEQAIYQFGASASASTRTSGDESCKSDFRSINNLLKK